MSDSTFVVIRRHGPAWNDSLPLRAQADWDKHADFMDDLTARGFIFLGGPLTDDRETLLIVEAETEQQVRETLLRDPWEPAGILITDSVRHWTVLLDSRKR
jgi:uncharacterized protein YciI